MSEKNILNTNNVQNAPVSNPLNIPQDKILQNNQNLKLDIMQFKDEILGEIKLLKKSVTEKYNFTTSFMNDKFKKYDNKLSSYSDSISDIKSNISTNDDVIKEVKSLLDFRNKIKDQMLTMDIKVNNMERETKNNIFRIDNLLSDSILYPGIIGKTSKFKTFRQMLDYLLAQTSQNLTYREKNNLDINQFKKKISTVESNLQYVRDSINKEINNSIEKKLVESDIKIKNMISQYDEKLKEAKEQNAEYIKEIQETVKNFKDKLEEFEIIKNKISEEIKSEGKKLKEENDQTQNIFRGYKKEFNLMKDRFTQLSEFIKDVRFRINLGQEVKRREYYHMSSKIDFSKKQKISNDNYINIYNTKYQNDNDLPDFLQNQNNYSPNSNTLRTSVIYKNEDNKKAGYYSAGNKRIKNKIRNATFILKKKEGRNQELNLGEIKTSKTNRTNKTGDELSFGDNETDRYNNKSLAKDEEEKNLLVMNNAKESNLKGKNGSDGNRREMIKRRHTTNLTGFHLENYKKFENRNNFPIIKSNSDENNAIIKEILEDSNINENKKDSNMINLKEIVNEIDDKNKIKKTEIKILNKKIIRKELLNGPKKNLFSLVNKTPQNKIFTGINKKNNTNIKSLSSISERINILSNTRLEMNNKAVSTKNKFTTINDNNIIESKKNSKIYFPKKTTVKNLTRIQSAFTPKYPSIPNFRPSLKNNSNSSNNIKYIDSTEKNITKIDNNKTSFEEDKMNNITKNSKGFTYNSLNKNFYPNKLKSHLSPNVKILQHSVEKFSENNGDANNITGMINNLQKYINGYNSNYISKKDINQEKKRLAKNSDYYKFKEIVNGNNYNNISDNDNKEQKNKVNMIEIGFNEIK